MIALDFIESVESRDWTCMRMHESLCLCIGV